MHMMNVFLKLDPSPSLAFLVLNWLHHYMENTTKREGITNGNISGNALIRRLIRGVLMTETVILAATCLTSAFIMKESEAAFSVALGAVISILSFTVLAIVIYKSMMGQGRAVILITMLGTIKVVVLGGLLWWLISAGVADPIAFMIGFATMVITLIIEGIKANKAPN